MAAEPIVSVVVPVYNTAPYVRECLDSLINQTLRDIEIICVDDGSTDGSDAILEEYAAVDPRVRVIRQQNQYAGVARNNGMAAARGTYIMFCDSDDWMALDALELMSSQAEHDRADICVCGGERFYEGIDLTVTDPSYLNMKRVPEELPFNRESNEEFIFSFTTIMMYNKMYRRAFLREHQLAYSSRRNGEDVVISALALWKAQRITVVNKSLVCYRIDRSDSLVGTLSQDPLGPLESWLEVYRAIGSELGATKQSFDSKVVGVARHTLRNIASSAGMETGVAFVRDVMFPEMRIGVQPEGYYPTERYNEFITMVRDLPFNDFMAAFLYMTARDLELENARKLSAQQKLRAERRELKGQLKTVREERDKARKRVTALEGSTSLKVGRALTAPFRALKR
ncbi:glycosyltransferase family 2 protein [Adlercreutzia equolifaciens]|uniref:glycosyltransferase family 2 protein n=1 Tax=Adlercreutzia equolifaciens TaxID=446660 RepID=UPI0023B1099F|nr:glycosyltransferase family 2 protein [Adlercreutzia equolifaciens]MDE8702815.1 glycosyltransferase family 2 protein [Adlercreutzia equolifaciens]